MRQERAMQLPSIGKFTKIDHLSVVLAVIVASFVAGCKILDTRPIRMESGEICHTAMGAYFLPRSNIAITIGQSAKHPEAPIKFTLSDARPGADRNQIYCLDYLGSGFAEDTVNVTRDGNGLLTKITSVAADKSKEIALKIAQIGLIAATGNPDVSFRAADFGTESDWTTLASYEFDPFDRERLAEVNTVLASVFGYCLTVDRHTLPNRDTQIYCNDPRRYQLARQDPDAPEVPAVADLEEANRGILYRPNQTHQLFVFRRPDPQVRTPWKLYQTKQVEMPNIAPIFSIGVDRSIFVTRSTTLEFDYGVLRDIYIEKPSEALEFVEIPLRVVQAIVKVPAEILKVRIAATDNQKKLIDAQKELILNQRAAIEAAKTLRSSGAAVDPSGTVRSAGTPQLSFRDAPVTDADLMCDQMCRPKLDKSGCAQNCRAFAASCSSTSSSPAALNACLRRNLGGN